MKWHRPARHHRNTLVWTAACFFALQLGLAVLIEWRLPVLRDPDYGIRVERLRARVTRAATRPFTVGMVGSSRASQAFDAGRLEAPLAAALERPAVVFNFGIRGAGTFTHFINLNRLLAKGVR